MRYNVALPYGVIEQTMRSDWKPFSALLNENAKEMKTMGVIQNMISHRVISPVATLFQILKRFDEVPLPDKRIYKLAGSELLVNESDAWVRSELSVNDLLALVHELTGEEWRDLLRGCVGDDEADAWRNMILTYPLPGRNRIS